MPGGETITSKKLSPKKKNGNGAAIKGSIVIVMMIAAMIGYYYYLSNKERQKEPEDVKMSVAQELISRNLTTNYPPTPKEVIKYYSDITKCFYNEEYTQEELELLVGKTMELYDDDLLAANEYGQYLIKLKEEINYFSANSIRIASYSLSASTDVDTFTDNGYSFARLYCNYVLTSGTKSQTVEEVFLLRRDDNGHWRIYGWELAENVDLEKNTD